MKINMWVLSNQLEKYKQKLNIFNTEAKLEGVRLCAGAESAAEDRYVSLYHKHDSSWLQSGDSCIELPHVGIDEAMNAVLEIFERMQMWENELNRLTSERSLQGIIDFGNTMLGNPMILSDSAGNVLAMSSAYLYDEIDANWHSARDTGHVSMGVMGAPMYNEDETLSSWDDTPTLFHTQDGDRFIISYIRAGGNRAAGFGMKEHGHPVRKGDLLFFRRLSEAIASVLEEKTEENTERYLVDILQDILNGRKIEPSLLSAIELDSERPWQLLLIANPFRSDSIYKQSLLYRLARYPLSNISFLYENRVLVLTSAKNAEALSKAMDTENGRQYYQLVLSLPFDKLKDMPARYRQCVYTMEQSQGEPGIYHSEQFCFDYLLSLLTRINEEQNLSHPALAILKQHDLEKNTEYYRTLFVYLLYERSILTGAEHLHIHKNTFLYRIQKIREMIDVDLDDPEVRMYLLLGYYTDGER